MLTSGDTVAGRYRLEKQLGRGSFGVVWKATHDTLGAVALKCMNAKWAENAEQAERFLREAKTAFHLKNEHIVDVYDSGVFDDTSYIAMELLEGKDLDAYRKSRGTLPIEEATDYLLQLCVALAEPHAKGIVHRDLKPQNLFLARQPDGGMMLKVLDFGIAKVDSGDGGMTATSAVIGTPAYMSPEQARSTKSVDPRADIWSLGVIAYELLTGERAFGSSPPIDVLIRVCSEEPRSIASVRRDVPAELASIVHHCLEKDRDRRFSDVAELARLLVPFGPPTTSRTRAARAERYLGSDHEDGMTLPAGLVWSPLPHDDRSDKTTTTTPIVAGQSSMLPDARNPSPASFKHRRWLWVALGSTAAVSIGLALAGLGVPREDGPSREPTPSALGAYRTSENHLEPIHHTVSMSSAPVAASTASAAPPLANSSPSAPTSMRRDWLAPKKLPVVPTSSPKTVDPVLGSVPSRQHRLGF